MLLETRLRDDTYILIDAEAAIGIDKGTGEYHSPAEALDTILTLAGQVTSRLKELVQEQDGPDRMTATFGIKVDGSASVAVARKPEDGQIRITAEWSKSD